MKRNTAIDQIDANAGECLRFARTFRGMSQDALGRLEGITFQQIQKYESGANRISASRLAHLACFLRFPIGWFFLKMPDSRLNERAFTRDGAVGGVDEANTETHSLVCAYYGIADREQRLAVCGLIKSLGPIDGDSGVWAGAKRRPFASPETG